MCRQQGGRKHPHQEFIQLIPRTFSLSAGVLFRVDRTSEPIGKKVMGFGADVSNHNMQVGDYLKQIMPGDLLKYGLIPEWWGVYRLSLWMRWMKKPGDDSLKPKNALVKQYQNYLNWIM